MGDHTFLFLEVFVFGGAAIGWALWELRKTNKVIAERKSAEQAADRAASNASAPADNSAQR